MSPVPDLAQIRFQNAVALFDEFVHATVKHPDAATLRGLERRFAERVQIQPSYWSQIKARSRQIGERLARQFEQLCHKPYGWMDQWHGANVAPLVAGSTPGPAVAPGPQASAPAPADSHTPQDDDERFIMGLVLTYYRRHPQRARTRLLDLLGEVLTPAAEPAPGPAPSPPAGTPRRASATAGKAAPPSRAEPADDAHALWLRSQSGVAPLKHKK